VRIHLYTTDVSGLGLIERLRPDDEVTAILVPANRGGTDKVAQVRAEASVPVIEQPRGQTIGGDVPPADAALCWLYSQLLVPEDMSRYPRGGLNMHGGRLPDYRGASVLQWAIINGEDRMGVTWHRMAVEVDTGGILAESEIPIPREATAADMRTAMIEEGLRLFPDAWRRFAEVAPPVRVIDPGDGKVWPQRRPTDGRIEAGWPERRVRDMVRALCPPWPAATIERDGTLYRVRAVRGEAGPDSLPYRTAEGAVLHLEVEAG